MNDISKSQKTPFLENVRALLEARENVLNTFKSNLFPIENLKLDPKLNPPVFCTPKQTRARSKIPKVEITLFRFNENFVNEMTKQI